MTGSDIRPLRDDVRRDKWGRPLIVQEDGTDVAYARASGLASVLEDDSKLTDWKMRNVAVGLSQRKDLILSVNAHRDNKWKLNELVQKCMDFAVTDGRATIGTGLHTITETVDRGLDPGYVPDEFVPDLEAYIKRTKPLFDHFAIEPFSVCDELQVAGTPDRMSRTKHDLEAPDGTIIPAGSALVTDLKTSESLKYGGIKFATQLSVYAHSVPYDYQKEVRGEWEYSIRQDWGVIYHVPAGKGEAHLYWVDLTLGWEMANLAIQVKKARKKWDLLHRGLVETDYGATFPPVTHE